MISIFNGRSRTLGAANDADVYLQLSVSLREHLYLFKGAKLAVFMAIALHSNEEGWSYPKIELLVDETGFTDETVCKALNELCALEVEGHRVLLRSSGRGRANRAGTFGNNHYLIFPTFPDVRRFEIEGEDPPAARERKNTSTVPEKSDTEKTGTEKSDTDFSGTKNKQVLKEEPPSQEKPQSQPHIHTPPNESPPENRVGVCSKFTLEQVAAYVESERRRDPGAITNPRGLAIKLYRTGDADLFIDACLNPPLPLPPAALLNPRDCPDCGGTNFHYPAGTTGGVARCPHKSLYDRLARRAATEVAAREDEAQARGSPAAVG